MLRLGCGGCLTVLVLVGVLAGTAWAIVQAMRPPEIVGLPTSPADGLRAQQKIFDLVRRAQERRRHTVSLSDRELNAFLSRHLEGSADLALRNLVVRLPTEGTAEVAGQLPLGQLLALPPASALAAVMPRAWLRHDVWMIIRTRVTVETGTRSREARQLRLDVERFWIGRLPLPEVMLRVLLDPAALRVLRPQIPDAIDDVRIEPGRLVLQSGA